MAIREDEIEIIGEWNEKPEAVAAQIPNESTSLGRLVVLQKLKEVMGKDSSVTSVSMPSKYTDLYQDGSHYFGSFWNQLLADARGGNRYVYDRGTELVLAFQAGNRNGAFEELISLYINLTHKVLRKYSLNGSFEEDDFMQEAVFGIYEGAKQFDIKMRVLFSTFVYYKIRGAVVRAFHNTGRMIRIPVDEEILMVKFKKTRDRLQKKSGVVPSIDLIATELGVTLIKAKKTQKLMKDRVQVTSLHCKTNWNDEQGAELQDLLPDPDAISVFETIASSNLFGMMAACISSLGERDQKIIKMRLGLDGYSEHTLEEIGQELGGLTRERIRQLEAKILENLKKMLKRKGFREENIPEVMG